MGLGRSKYEVRSKAEASRTFNGGKGVEPPLAGPDPPCLPKMAELASEPPTPTPTPTWSPGSNGDGI